VPGLRSQSCNWIWIHGVTSVQTPATGKTTLPAVRRRPRREGNEIGVTAISTRCISNVAAVSDSDKRPDASFRLTSRSRVRTTSVEVCRFRQQQSQGSDSAGRRRYGLSVRTTCFGPANRHELSSTTCHRRAGNMVRCGRPWRNAFGKNVCLLGDPHKLNSSRAAHPKASDVAVAHLIGESCDELHNRGYPSSLNRIGLHRCLQVTSGAVLRRTANELRIAKTYKFLQRGRFWELGLRTVSPASHQGKSKRSDEEVAWSRKSFSRLLGGQSKCPPKDATFEIFRHQ